MGAANDREAKAKLLGMKADTMRRNFSLNVEATVQKKVFLAMVRNKAPRETLRSAAASLRGVMAQIARNEAWLQRCIRFERDATLVTDQRSMMEGMKALTKMMDTNGRDCDVAHMRRVAADYSRLSTETGMRQEIMDEAINDVTDELADSDAHAGFDFGTSELDAPARVESTDDARALDAFIAKMCAEDTQDGDSRTPPGGAGGGASGAGRGSGTTAADVFLCGAPSPPRDPAVSDGGGAAAAGGPPIVVDPQDFTAEFEARLARLRAEDSQLAASTAAALAASPTGAASAGSRNAAASVLGIPPTQARRPR